MPRVWTILALTKIQHFFFFLSMHSSMAMEGQPLPYQVQERVNSRQWWKVVHPMEIEPSLPSKVEYREMKHFKEWFPWLIPFFVIANVIVFIVTMYVNDCPNSNSPVGPVPCIAPFLGRFSFQPFSENPLLGPSLAAWVVVLVLLLVLKIYFYLIM